MNIVVTGGAGFIGSHTATRLLELGHRVVIIDNLDPYYPEALKRYNLEKVAQAGEYRFEHIDIRDSSRLNELFAEVEPEVVIHLAAKAGVRNSLAHPEEYIDVNVRGTVALLEVARHHGVEKMLVASSSSVYGSNTKVPFSEADPVENQISPYAASKRALETVCRTYSQVYGFPIQMFRFFTVYGPSGRPDMAPAKFTKAIFDGTPISVYGSTTTQRDYTYIDDIVDGLVSALKKTDQFELYNLGNNQPVSLATFIATIEKIAGKKAQLKLVSAQPGDVEKTWADISKAQQQLDYQPSFTLEQGLEAFITWYQGHQELYR